MKGITMERILRTYKQLKQSNETGFIPFSVAGFPDCGRSLKVFHKLVEAGGDILEFGYPFSDPVADGPVIQKAAAQAIRNGITMDRALDMIGEIRAVSNIPIIFFSYFNPIHRYGRQRFVDRAKDCGIDGVLIVDLPLEEAPWLKPMTDRAGLAWIFLATPTTPQERITAMSRQGSGFLYYVSVTGVTGSRTKLPEDLTSKCSAIRDLIALPLAVGFGVSGAEQASQLGPHVDSVVVGSAIVSRVQRGDTLDELGAWLAGIKGALRNGRTG
ncbi:MAG: tryptophan synthase subunit alpha [Desulfomonilaceae bacterium]|nr:tryptophan synthase subunit alpha [Desulfomonilaceae bacterium]